MTERVKKVCAWCGKHLGGPRSSRTTTHGICDPCYERVAGAPRKSRRNRPNPTLVVMNPEAPVDTSAAEKTWARFHLTDADQVVEFDDPERTPEGTPEVLAIIGRLESLIYRVPDSSGKAGAPFEHEFSDFGSGAKCRHRKVLCGCRPVLCADERGRLYIIGGKYTVEAEGIVG